MRTDSCAYKLHNLNPVVRSPPGIIMIYRVERLVISEMESLELVITFIRARSYFDFNVCSCAGTFFLLPNGVLDEV